MWSVLNLPSNMKLLWLFCVLSAVLGQPGFGNSYLKNASLCRPWTCINTKLGLPDSLPPRDLAEASYRRLLPQGPWQDMLGQVLDNCYENRTRRYTNTCPGQALMHCVVEQMISNCPEEHMRKDDACSTVTTLAGFKDMFTQSVYHDLEKNLPTEVRPTYFLKNYFHQKCCTLPELFSSTELKECGFESFLKNYTHGPLHVDDNSMVRSVQDRRKVIKAVSLNQLATPTPSIQSVPDNGDFIQAVSLNQMTTPAPSEPPTTDALDCCDMSDFIQPSWRSECGFHLNWKGVERLVIANYTTTTEAPVTTTTARPDAPKDLMYLPHSCPQESCVFSKLGIIDESGTVNFRAFNGLLYNFTDEHPTWLKAASRVSQCLLGSKGRNYQADCEINRVLACTLDVLTENCPYNMKSNNSCKHNRQKRVCQISSPKFGPKHRREICMLPPLVRLDDLAACGLETLYKPEYVLRVPEPKPKRHAWSSLNLCVDQTPSTTCLMNKMGILNKYKFMDYFKMKDRIRQFTSNQSEWSALREFYMSAFINIPMYGEHCSSQKKLLNVVDSMLMSCPVSKRVDSPQCAQLYQDIANSTLKDHEDATKDKIDQMTKHQEHVIFQRPRKHHRIDPVIRRPRRKQHHKPLFYGFIDNKDSPKVDVIHIKPSLDKDRPLVLTPVYLREPNLSLTRPFHRDPMLRSNLVMSPSWVHKLTNTHTTASPYITTESSTTDFEFSTVNQP